MPVPVREKGAVMTWLKFVRERKKEEEKMTIVAMTQTQQIQQFNQGNLRYSPIVVQPFFKHLRYLQWIIFRLV